MHNGLYQQLQSIGKHRVRYWVCVYFQVLEKEGVTPRMRDA